MIPIGTNSIFLGMVETRFLGNLYTEEDRISQYWVWQKSVLIWQSSHTFSIYFLSVSADNREDKKEIIYIDECGSDVVYRKS